MQFAVAGEVSANHVTIVIDAIDGRLQSAWNIHACEFVIDKLESVEHAIHAKSAGRIAADEIEANDFTKIIDPSGNRCCGAGHIDGHIAEAG